MAIVETLTSNATAIATALVGGALLFLWRLSNVQLDVREPPILKPTIPIIGHVLDMFTLSHAFFTKTYKQAEGREAYTLPMMGGKVYFVASPELVNAMIKSRSLSFDPVLRSTIAKLFTISKEGVRKYVDPSIGLETRWTKNFYGCLNGVQLKEINKAVLTDVFRQLDELPDEVNVEDSWLWLRDKLSFASTAAMLGRDNPFCAHPSLVDDYWYVDNKLVHFALGPAPWMTAPSAWMARNRIHHALIQYTKEKKHDADDVSALWKGSYDLLHEFGFSESDIAAFLQATLQAALFNTIPTFNWYFVHIWSDPSLVFRLREEVSGVVAESLELRGDGKREMTMNMAKIEERCPLLVAAFHENLRTVAEGAFNRVVMEDTIISNGKGGQEYLLKKGNNLMASQSIIHVSEEHWGSQAGSFDPTRFSKDTGVPGESESHIKPGTYVPFGGGKHLCPGRHFASMEIWGMMIALLLSFDITDAEGRTLTVPERTMPTMTSGIGRPVAGTDLRLKLSRRKDWNNITWKVDMA
ncbi:similar to cytochrome P450 [Botrytis cinerea T4]|uniref:Similar to cytochrome P450 n=1 Tax=Botryotinia fuckeliana (strain T4) TaxID=999810 RepID=G2XV84_BOTF4|nr:similar to cytochrome P450 [Botrytis cinerea T4]